MTCALCNNDINDEKIQIEDCNHTFHVDCWRLFDAHEHKCVHCKIQYYNEYINNAINQTEYVCIVGSFMRIVSDYIRRMNYVIHNGMISGYFWEIQNFDAIRNNAEIGLREIVDYDSDFYNMDEIKLFVMTMSDGTRRPVLILKHRFINNFIITKINNNILYPQLYIYQKNSHSCVFNTLNQLIINSSIGTSGEFDVVVDNKKYTVNASNRTMIGNDENYFMLPYSNHQITNA